MSNLFWKHFNLCFSKLKCLPLIQAPPTNPEQDEDNQPSPTFPTTSIIIKNFNSLYDLTSVSTASKSLTHSTTDFFSSSDGSDDPDSPPDFATIFASQRFFFSSPGRSNSIFESLDTRQDPDNALTITGSVKVPKYSLDPYVDFRRSMQEMVEARNFMDVTSELEYLHELLLCYLTLNPRQTHKYIIRAFADLVSCILLSSPSSSTSNHCRESKNRRQRYIPRQLQV